MFSMGMLLVFRFSICFTGVAPMRGLTLWPICLCLASGQTKIYTKEEIAKENENKTDPGVDIPEITRKIRKLNEALLNMCVPLPDFTKSPLFQQIIDNLQTSNPNFERSWFLSPFPSENLWERMVWVI